eukprot:scaffold755_cov83-Skeletonema_dohrnii-CCMP3373.AAC.5
MNYSHPQDKMNEQGNSIAVDAARRIAQLTATNAALREALASKNAHIEMLEDKILTISVELASSRAREDEQNLMMRLSQISQVTMMSEDDNGNNGPTSAVDVSIKSAPAAAQTSSFTSTQSAPRMSFFSGWGSREPSSRTLQTDETMQDSATRTPQASGGGGGMGGLIGNMIQLDKSGYGEDLRVNFPRGRGRRNTIMTDESPVSPSQEQRRMTMVGQLFRLGKSERAGEDDAFPEIEEEEQEAPQQQQRRRPNRSKMLRIQASTRLISSTVAFPREDDNLSVGFE